MLLKTTVVVASAEGSAVLVALTMMVLRVVVAGATNRPFVEIVPALADQVTAVWLVPVTVAVNWIFPPAAAVGLIGEIVIFVQETHGSTFTV